MSLNSVLSTFTTQASAAGLSEGDWYVKAIAEKDTAVLSMVKAEAINQGDTALEAELNTLLTTPGEVRYVATFGDDATATGGRDKPYRNVKTAIDAITDASSTKPYQIIVLSGVYDETGLVFKPYINIAGAGMYQTFIGNNNAGQIGVTLNFNDSNELYITDCTLRGGLNIARDPLSISTFNFVVCTRIRVTTLGGPSFANKITYNGSASYPNSDYFIIRDSDCPVTGSSPFVTGRSEFNCVSYTNENSTMGVCYYSDKDANGNVLTGTSEINIRKGSKQGSTTIVQSFKNPYTTTNTFTLRARASDFTGAIILMGKQARVALDASVGYGKDAIITLLGAESIQATAEGSVTRTIGLDGTVASNWLATPAHLADAVNNLAEEKYAQTYGTSAAGMPITAAGGVTIADSSVTASRASDSSLTVTGTGTTMTISAQPVDFEVHVGMSLTVGAETRTVTSVSNDGRFPSGSAATARRTFTIDSAFTVDPSAAACTVVGPKDVIKLSAAPSFPLRPGATLTVGAETKTITLVKSSTTVIINSAFTVDPSASACTVKSRATFAAKQKIYTVGSGGPVTVTATPQIEAGTRDGQEMLLVGTDDINTVTLADGNGLSLTAGMVLGAGDMLELTWDAAASVWVEKMRKV